MSFLSLDNESTTKWVQLSIREHYDFLRPLFSRFDCTKIEEIAIQLAAFSMEFRSELLTNSVFIQTQNVEQKTFKNTKLNLEDENFNWNLVRQKSSKFQEISGSL